MQFVFGIWLGYVQTYCLFAIVGLQKNLFLVSKFLLIINQICLQSWGSDHF